MTTIMNVNLVENFDRVCGGCNLCCKLLPMRASSSGFGAVAVGAMTMKELHQAMPDFDKAAGVRCPYQSHAKGCAVYDRRPPNCRMWNCRWLTGDDTAELSRPDRSHVVIDVMPDFVTAIDNETGVRTDIQVVQLWVDPQHPEAWRHPSIMAYLERRGREGIAALIRYNSSDGFTVMPPDMTTAGKFIEVRHGTMQKEHTPAQISEVLVKR